MYLTKQDVLIAVNADSPNLITFPLKGHICYTKSYFISTVLILHILDLYLSYPYGDLPFLMYISNCT